MEKYPKSMKAFYLILIISLVVVLSIVSSKIWGVKSEKVQSVNKLVIEMGMSVNQFGQVNGFSNPVLKDIFGLRVKSDLEKKLEEYGTPDQIKSMVSKKLALASEGASKNWIKIFIKFVLWFIFLTTVFMLLRKRKFVSGIRKWLLFGAIFIFGVIMGSDPSPMGTVKDAIYLYVTSHVIFLPRLIALTIFLVIVFIANKNICAWGCQVGTLQDLIFRINQSDKNKAVIGKRIKLPFFLTNSIRFAFLCIFTLVAIIWGFDFIETIDPFKIYNPTHIGIIGGIFIGVLLLVSLFIYRPWCHFFCPFGLTGWIVEKISRIRISVNYETCIGCQKCADACPSTVMGAILRRDKKTIPDCFACYTCREACPTNSISFSSRKRTLPPPDHFNKKSKK